VVLSQRPQLDCEALRSFRCSTSVSVSVALPSLDFNKNNSIEHHAARSNNVGITLARLKLSPPRIKKAILEVDDEALSEDNLATLARLIPTLDEVSDHPRDRVAVGHV
jgi:hypothetical protein